MTMYKTTEALPKGIRKNLPKHAQEIFKEAFNSALEQYSDDDDTEATANRVAWSAVKQKYEKVGDHWREKDS